MSRGFKKDAAATRKRGFKDKRSFISLPKFIPGDALVAVPHLVLYGKDKSDMREIIFSIDRRMCELCGVEFTSPEEGEWDHIRTKSGERCDCPTNGRRVHHNCHLLRHSGRQVQLRKVS